MGLFGQSTGFDGDVEKATSETNTNENWSLILDVCDKVNANSRNAKDCLKSIMKRMGHTDPHISMQAITLLDACVSNCGKTFHLEIASREFQNEFKRLLGKVQPKVAMKMRQVLKSWAENEFKTDPELNLIPSLYNKLRQEGYDFSNLSDKPKSKMSLPKDPNVVSSQQEEDDLAKAIELSLKETKGSPKNQANAAAAGIAAGGAAAAATSSAYPSLYPSVTASAPSQTSSQTSLQQTEPRKVRALYDFEAAEENELTFFAGEMLHVLDDSDPNWWKGQNQRGEGLFPSNFVSADLSIDPERLEINQQHKMKKSTQFEEDSKELQQKTEAAAAAAAEQKVEIDEPKVDRLLYLLNEANPEDPSKDTEEMLRLEQEVHQMGPLIDAELERVDRKHAELSKLSSDLVDAINLYHSLMKDDRAALGSPYSMTGAGMLPAGYAPQPSHHMMPPAGHMMYGGAVSNPPFVQAATGGYGPQSYQGPMSTTFSAAPTSNFAMGNIPMNYQNGHMNSQLQQRIPGMQQLPHAQMSLQHPSQQHPQQQQQQPQQQPQMFPAASMQNGTAQPSQQMNGNGSDSQQQAQSAYQMLQQPSAQHQHQQQQQQNQQFVVQQQQPVTASNHQSQQQQAPQQFMSPQHQNQTQPPAAAPQQHIPFMNTQTQPQPNSHFYSNGPAPQQFPTQQPNNQTNMPSMAPPQPAMLPPNSAATLDQFGQLQHQMANLGIGSPHAASLPYQPNIQQNIPIYQQQR